LSICPQAAKKLTSSLKAWRAKLDDPPASGYITVASAYVAAVNMKINPATTNATGVNPSANAAVTPSA
jgi:hypothetical protein